MSATSALLLPGWGTAPARMRPMVDALDQRGVTARPYAYEPRGSIRAIAARLAQAAGRLPGEVHLLGHSLGGLVAASAVLHHGAPVASVTTVNTPWRGTWAAWTAQPGDPLGHELRWGADALDEMRDLLAQHLDADSGPRWHAVSALGDLAAPATTALRVPVGDRMERSLVLAAGHSRSLDHPRVLAAVSQRIGVSVGGG